MSDEKEFINTCKEQNKRITEMRNLIQGNAISDLNHYEELREIVKSNISDLDLHTKQLNELKDDHKALDDIYKFMFDKVATNLEKIEEVLRDIYKKLELITGYTCDTEQFNYVFPDEYWENKKKLSGEDRQPGGTGNKTEKKELDCGVCKHDGGAYGAWCFDVVEKCLNYEKFEKKEDPYITLQKEAFDDSDEFPFEDSGGKKELREGAAYLHSINIQKEVKKLPEPIPWNKLYTLKNKNEPRENDKYVPLCPICGKWLDCEGCKYFISHQENCENCAYYNKELGSGLGNNLIVVKREKIDFWRKELLNKTDEVLKSMREVLGIE